MVPVATVPRINYHASAHAPYTTRRQPEAALPAHDYYKCQQLAFYLNSCQLSNMPRGFPLPYRSLYTHPLSIYTARLEPYKFHQELPIPNYPSGQAVIFFNGHNPGEDYLIWRIFLSGPDYSSLRNSHSRAVATVQVNIAVSKSFFWQALMNDPSTILRALAISLEIETTLSIELLDTNTVVYQTLGSRERKNYLVVKRP